MSKNFTNQNFSQKVMKHHQEDVKSVFPKILFFQKIFKNFGYVQKFFQRGKNLKIIARGWERVRCVALDFLYNFVKNF